MNFTFNCIKFVCYDAFVNAIISTNYVYWEFDMQEQHYGFKKLNIDNIIKPDVLGLTENINIEEYLDYANNLLEPALNNNVPECVRKQFEVARGTIIYGLLFYPLYQVGTECLFRVSENALRQKCIQLNIYKDKMTFRNLLDKLIKVKVISKNSIWEIFYRLRNMYCHPDNQDLITYTEALKMMNTISNQINHLYK